MDKWADGQARKCISCWRFHDAIYIIRLKNVSGKNFQTILVKGADAKALKPKGQTIERML